MERVSTDVLKCTLAGAVVVTTGACGGIGRAICSALAEAGAKVVATDMTDVCGDLKVDLYLQHDVTSPESWKHVLDEVDRRFGRLDCLVNNAGIALVECIADTSIEQWRRVQIVNVESILLGLKASLALLRASGNDRFGGSSVVNVASTAGLVGVAFNAAYSASKGAVTLLTKSAAKEFSGLGYPIRVNSVHPGAVETHMIDSIMERYVAVGLSPSVTAARADFANRTPLGRLARPEEIAGGVIFLCSPAAAFMTGAELIIDGGALC